MGSNPRWETPGVTVVPRETKSTSTEVWWAGLMPPSAWHTWQDEEDARNEGQDGSLWPDVSDVTDDKGGEDEEQWDHWEGRRRPDHFCRRDGSNILDDHHTLQIKPRPPDNLVLGYRDDCCRGLFSFIIYSSCWQRSDSRFVPLVTQSNIFMHEISVCMWDFCLLRMLAVFSVVISISGSVKYSDATHLPFSGPEGETEGWKERKWRNIRVTSGSEDKYMFI